MSTHCEALKRLHVLHLIKVSITDSPSLTDSVKASSEVLIRKLKADVRTIASDKIISAMQIKAFGKDTEAHQAAVGIYMIDLNLFTEVFGDVFKEIFKRDSLSFEQIIKLLNNFEEDGPIVYAYCSLFKYIDYLSEHLWSFECVVTKLSRKPELDPHQLDKLNKLLVGIKKKSAEHVKCQAMVSYLQDGWF